VCSLAPALPLALHDAIHGSAALRVWQQGIGGVSRFDRAESAESSRDSVSAFRHCSRFVKHTTYAPQATCVVDFGRARPSLVGTNLVGRFQHGERENKLHDARQDPGRHLQCAPLPANREPPSPLHPATMPRRKSIDCLIARA
jgi:hypothetical protein